MPDPAFNQTMFGGALRRHRTRAVNSVSVHSKVRRHIGALIALLAPGAAAYGQVVPEPRTTKINDRVHVLLGPIQRFDK